MKSLSICLVLMNKIDFQDCFICPLGWETNRLQINKQTYTFIPFQYDTTRTPQDMDGTLTLIYAKLETTWDITTKISDFYNLGRNWFSPNLKGVAQKMGLPCSFEVWDVFGGKSKSKALKAFKFGPKRVPIEVNNWWKFGVDISNLFWEIQN